jgi:hypothetical protein
MDVFTKLFGDLLAFVYHCFDRIVIHGYLSALSRPEQVVHFVRKIVGVPVVSKEILSQRTADYQNWVEAYARNHHTPIEWAEKGVRKEDHVRPWLRRMANKNAYGEPVGMADGVCRLAGSRAQTYGPDCFAMARPILMRLSAITPRPTQRFMPASPL